MADGDRRTKSNLIRLAEVLNRFNQMELGVPAMRDACSMDPTPLERVQFAEMLRIGERGGVSPRYERSKDLQPKMYRRAHAPARRGCFLRRSPRTTHPRRTIRRNSDERQQILKERIQCLVAAGQLEQQIDQLAKELASTTPEPIPSSRRTLADAGSVSGRGGEHERRHGGGDQGRRASARINSRLDTSGESL